MDGPAGGSELDGWRHPQTPAGLQLHSGLTGPSPPYTPLCTSGMGVGRGTCSLELQTETEQTPSPKGAASPPWHPVQRGSRKMRWG